MVKILKFILIIIIVVAAAAVFSYWRGINDPAGRDEAEVVFTVAPGDGVEAIGEKLKAAGLIGSDLYFKIYAALAKAGGKLQAGEYALSPGMNIKEVVSRLINGQSLSQEATIKIIEGWTIDDIGEYLNKQNLPGDDFMRLAKTYISEWPFEFPRYGFFDSAPARVDFEGYFFPDTYRIYRDSSAEDIIKKMFDNFDAKLTPDLRAEIGQQGKTIHEIVTMASIVEREVMDDSERPIVAGILYKRLAIGMRLEVDSSINYITGKNNPQSTLEDLSIDSPYNTYMYYGLPPGPISNPGMASIEAAIYPVASDYLFYLNRLDTGETIFSRTLDEHNANKYKYLR